MAQITVVGILKDGTQIGIKNLLPVFVNFLLFALTCWIPYINIGTLIGMINLPAKMSKDETLSFTEIFNPVYRKYMGEGFLTLSLMVGGICAGYMLFIIPGIVISIAWSLALLLVFDKGMDPIAALRKSNDLTYGNKLMIFLSILAYSILMSIVMSILSLIPAVGPILAFIFLLAAGSLLMGVHAYIYRELTK
ncbi:MAG: hypothetical protein FWG13_04075 [Leptospirales bacterium]|nr:hypothetical protein [Leptospirales bacterium]